MPEIKGIIALDLDGTLLNSKKELTPRSRAALQAAAEAGWEIVPTTGRFYGGMPAEIRGLPFVNYTITINGAEAAEVASGKVIYKSELPLELTLEIMEYLDSLPVIYDCYQGNEAFMTSAQKELIDATVANPHYRKMLHELRQPVGELKDFLRRHGQDIQKTQFFTADPALRLRLLEELPQRFEGLCVSSSVAENVEINSAHANKGEALLALAAYLGLEQKDTVAFGDGLNDLSMLAMAGVGVAMSNACPEAKAAADMLAPSCDEDGVACIIERICLKKEG